MNSAFRIADQMIMPHRGRIVAHGTPEEIKHSADPLVQQFITGARMARFPAYVPEGLPGGYVGAVVCTGRRGSQGWNTSVRM